MADETKRPRDAVGENVKRIRGLRDMTVRDLSARLEPLGLKLSASGISEVENAARKVSTDELLTIAIALNTSVIDLLTPADGSPLAVAEGVEPLEPPWLELWLQGETPWPQEPWGVDAAAQLDGFLATVSEYRRTMHRRDLRPELQAIDGLKERVRRAIEAIEDPGAENDVPPAGMADMMRSHLQGVDSYVNLLANHIEKNGYGGR